MAKADSPTKMCGEDGCGRPLRARGLCSMHWKRQHGKRTKYLITCVVCEKQHMSDRPDGKLCSDVCRAEEYARRGWASPRRPRGPASRRTRAKRNLAKAARGLKGRRWVAGRCERCGHPFVSALAHDHGRYCSDTCKRRSSNSRRRARERGAHHERYSRYEIFKRDHWRCHICKRTTLRTKVVPHPRAPVIDHLVPLADGGDDTAANVATACFLCNSTKRECGGGEQLALIG